MLASPGASCHIAISNPLPAVGQKRDLTSWVFADPLFGKDPQA